MNEETLTIAEKNHHENMVAIFELMNKGENALTDMELVHLKEMALAAEKYEDDVLGLKPRKKIA